MTTIMAKVPEIDYDRMTQESLRDELKNSLRPAWNSYPNPRRYKFTADVLEAGGKKWLTIVPDGAAWVEIICPFCKFSLVQFVVCRGLTIERCCKLSKVRSQVLAWNEGFMAASHEDTS